MLNEKNNLSQKNLSSLIQWTSIRLITKQLNLRKTPLLKNLEDIINYYHKHISVEKIISSNNTQSESSTFNLISSDKIKQ